MPIKIDGADQLAELERKLTRLAETGMAESLNDAIAEGVKPFDQALKQSALALLPKRGGLNRSVADSIESVPQRLPKGLRVVSRGKGRAHDLMRLDRGLLRHPVFAKPSQGRREWQWVNQAIKPQFWRQAVAASEVQVRKSMVKAMDDIAQKL